MNLSPHNSAHIEQVKWEDAGAEISAIRRQVFIVEQGVPEALEWDGRDQYAIHVLAYFANNAVATGRLLSSGHIGRMAVLPAFRRLGIGAQILSQLLATAAQIGLTQVFLHAQIQAQGFYLKHGFQAKGRVFEDAGIPHVRMDLDLTSAQHE